MRTENNELQCNSLNGLMEQIHEALCRNSKIELRMILELKSCKLENT